MVCQKFSKQVGTGSQNLLFLFFSFYASVKVHLLAWTKLFPYMVILIKLDGENHSSLLTGGPKKNNLDGVTMDWSVPKTHKYMIKFRRIESI